MRLWVGVLLFAACVPVEPETPPAGRSLAEIVGGSVDNGDPAVVYFKMEEGACSATLISARMVITAAHCEARPGALGKVQFGNATAAPLRTVAVIDTAVEPSSDLRLLKLEKPVTDVVPIRINRLAPAEAAAIRHVGFGLDSYPQGRADLKRHVTLNVVQVYPYEIHFESSDKVSGVCYGDSGGPGLMRTGDTNEEFVAGVASYLVGFPLCQGTASDVRVDAFSGWIDGISAQWEASTCEVGDACKEGCAPVDPDCVCTFDNRCDLRCPTLKMDPDCNPECAADGICTSGVCPFRDPDCIALGSECSQDLQCQGRACARQGDRRFCSQGCTVASDCPDAMYCSGTNHVCLFRPPLGASCDANQPCAEGTCVDATCQLTCTTSSQCLSTERCVAERDNPGLCRPKPPKPEPMPKSGCAAAPESLWLLALLLYGSRTRRSRPSVVV